MIYQNLEGAMPPPLIQHHCVVCMAKSAHTLRIVGILNKTTRSNTQNNALGIGGLQGQYKKIGTDIIFLQNSRRVIHLKYFFRRCIWLR